MWTLQEALQLIRDLQPQLKPLHYHVALGGGVLNKGTSQKDLDLYLLRFDNDDDGEAAPLLDLLRVKWGPAKAIGEAKYESTNWQHKLWFSLLGRRIDVFVQ